MKKLITEINRRWNNGMYIEYGALVPSVNFPGIPWVVYEEYMRAQIIRAAPGEIGEIIVEFPPERSESNQLHLHPLSDRVVTVIGGSGTFIAERMGVELREELLHGTKVWMPRNTLHTFLAGPDALLVHSLHLPWIQLEIPRCLVYPENK